MSDPSFSSFTFSDPSSSVDLKISEIMDVFYESPLQW